MADTMDTLKNLLGDNAEDKIKSVMTSLSGGNGNDSTSLENINSDGLDQIMQIKNIMEQMTNDRNDPRANLLRSLKPYMRVSRQHSIDSAVKLLGLTRLTKLLGK